VAERAGAKWILTGSILKGERNLVLTSDISEAATGRVIATQRISGQQGEDLFALVDRLSSAVKADLALPQKARAEPDLPVADVTTHSAEAYRYYLEGLDDVRQLYTADAEQAFLKALEYDSTFAMAYYYLAGIKSGVESQRFAAKAMEYVDKVSQREKYYLRGMYAYAFGDYPAAIGMLEESIKKYPDDKQLYYTLGSIRRYDLHQLREAVEAQMGAIKIDPLYTQAYNELAYDYQALGDLDSSIWAINQYIRIAPLEANPFDTRGDLYAYNGKLDEAITSYKEALRIKPDFWASMYKMGDMYLFKRDYAQAEACFKACAASSDREERSRGRLRLALLPIYQGRLEVALGVLDDGLAADRLEQFQGTQCAWKHGLRAAIFAERLETERSVAEARAVADLMYEAYKTPLTQMNAYYIGRLAWAGRLTEAEAAARAMREKLGPTEDAQWEPYWLALSAIELARGSPDRAAGYLRKIIDVNPDPPFQVRYLLGQACLGAGKLADAVKELERAQSAYDDARAIGPLSSPKLHYLLGQAYEQSGWTDKAAEQYREFLLWWGNGDAGIPSVEDARQRLARLEAGT
jgi:tetratricopeptide (TPR) repeat protein